MRPNRTTERGQGSRRDSDGTSREAELLSRVARGESEAFAPLYDLLAPRAYGLALRIAGDASAAQDAVQEAFLRVWLRARSFDPARGSAAAWLLGIVRNAVLDQLRSGGAHERALRRAAEAALASCASERTEPHLEFAESRSALRDALARLPDSQRRMLEIAYFQDLSHAQIALREGVPLGTVKTRIRDGLIRLRRIAAQGATHDG
ncbi:MAG: sigma-70 family RNA polymerase sigma factor [Myxococcota bacterium]